MQEIEGIEVGARGLDLTVDTEQYSPGGAQIDKRKRSTKKRGREKD